TKTFGRWIEGQALSRGKLWRHELFARPVSDLFWAALLLLPIVGSLLQPWLQRKSVCAFLGFEEGDESRVGCLLHPSRWGKDHRQGRAFVFGCVLGWGGEIYFCRGAGLSGVLLGRARRSSTRRCENDDWIAYSRKCRDFSLTGGFTDLVV